MWEATVDAERMRFNEAVIPKPFASPPDEDVFELFRQREFSSALDKSYKILRDEAVPATPAEIEAVLKVWLVRLKCLLVLKLGVQAAEEAAACLGDLYKELDAELAEMPVVWDLKLLLVPATAKGINVAAIQLYYTLGAAAKKMNDLARLRLAGQHVTATLLSLRDYVTALDHLRSTYATTKSGETGDDDFRDETAYIIALVYLELGDTLTAREWIAKLPESKQLKLLELCAFADDEPASNSGVAELYRGHTTRAVELLRAEAVATPVPSITNLLVLFDLQHPDWRPCRQDLAQFLVDHGRTRLDNYAVFID